MRITLKGEPRSTGTIYRSVCRGKFPSVYMSNEGKSLKEDYGWQIKGQYKGKLLKEDLAVRIHIYFGTKRKADWDNFHKLSMDAFTGTVWEDDSQIQEAHVYKGYDKKNPRIEVEIKPL